MSRRTLPFLTFALTWSLSLASTGWAQQDNSILFADGAPGPTAAHAVHTPEVHRPKRDYTHIPIALRITLPTASRAQQVVSSEAERSGPLQIGFGRNLPSAYQGNLVPRLAWETQSDGTAMSALSVSSPHARALRITLRATLPAGADVRFFSLADPEQRFPPVQPQEVSSHLPAETPAGGPTEETVPLWSPVVEGDTLGVEISLPPAAAVSDVSLFVDRVSHLATSVRQATPWKLSDVGDAASCNIDVACRSTTPPNLARATAKMIFTRPDGMSFLCSGTLMVDSDDSSDIPYFLTANHCIDTQIVARSLNTYWGFERAACGGPAPTSVNQLTGGADLLTTDAETDATLLRLRETPVGPTWYAGWSGAPLLNPFPAPTEVVGIHHPRGDLKKWSRGRPIRNSTHILQETGQSVSSVLVEWSEGTIEGGSSGSGLFDTTGRLRGIASGGSLSGTVCGFSRESFYGRFDLFWPQVTRWLAETPDDHGGSRSRATGVEPNTEAVGYLERTGDVDYFRVEVAEVGNLTVETIGTTNTFGYLQDAQGQQLAGNDDAGESNNFRIVRQVTAGTYHVAVVGANGRTATGAYTLAVRFVAAGETTEHGNSRARATRVDVNTETAGALERAGDVDYFRFEVVEAGSLTVETTGTTDTVGYLQDAQGQYLAGNDNAGEGNNFRIVRQVTAGTYHVAVVGANGRTATGAYTLAVRLTATGGGTTEHGNSRDRATRVGLNTETAGTLERAGDVDYFRFEVAEAGSLTVETTGATNTVGYLGGTSGGWLSQDDDAGTDGNFRIVRRVTAGTYYVAVVGANGRTAIGAYTFAVRFTSGGEDGGQTDDHGNMRGQATRIGLNTTVAGVLERWGDVDYFQLTVTRAGTLEVETSGTTDTFGYLGDSTGRWLSQNDDAGFDGNFHIGRQVTAGTYYVAIVGGAGRTQTGAYTLATTLTVPPAPDDHGNTAEQATRVGPNSTTAGSIEHADDTDYFRITITQAGTLTVETTGTTDTYGYLQNAVGTTLAENDDGGVGRNFQIVEHVTIGTYYVEVEGFDEDDIGPYALRVRFTSTPSGGTGLRGLLGTWQFTFRIISTFTQTYRLSRVVATTGTPLISGTDQYGDPIIAGRIQDILPGSSLPYEYTLLDPGLIICRFYLFDKTGGNSIRGVYYQIQDGNCETSGGLSNPYSMTGVRLSLSTRATRAELQSQTAMVDQERIELQRAEEAEALERKSTPQAANSMRKADEPVAEIVQALSRHLENHK